MTFTPASAEQRFVLDHVVGISELTDTEMVDAVLEGVGQFAQGEWAPLARVGEAVGAKWSEHGVTMPEGFPQAYRAYVEGGWGTIGVAEEHGGQGLPFAIQTSVLETLGTANMGFALCPTLTVGAIEALAHHRTEKQRRL